jgi:dihydrolipoamide dehydrogenase
MSEEQATKAGHSIKVGKFPFVASGRALAIAQTDGFVKLVRDASTDRVLGVHIVGPNASDLIAEGTLAIEMGATAEDIALTVHTHPTLPEAVMEAAESSHGMAVHAVNRK